MIAMRCDINDSMGSDLIDSNSWSLRHFVCVGVSISVSNFIAFHVTFVFVSSYYSTVSLFFFLVCVVEQWFSLKTIFENTQTNGIGKGSKKKSNNWTRAMKLIAWQRYMSTTCDEMRWDERMVKSACKTYTQQQHLIFMGLHLMP